MWCDGPFKEVVVFMVTVAQCTAQIDRNSGMLQRLISDLTNKEQAITIEQALQQVRVDSTICIFGAITEPLLANGFCGTLFATVDPVLTAIYTLISGFCATHPVLQVRAIV